MKNQLTFNQYRGLDLAIFAVILSVFEYIILTAATIWFPDQLYTVSIVAAVTAIVMMRWGPYSAIHAVLGGLVFCLASGASAQQFLIYCLGNLFSMAVLLLIRLSGKERIKSDTLFSLFYALCVQLLMQIGRAVVALVLGHSFEVCLGFITTDSLSIIFTLVIIWIARHLDGIFEDQKSYLIRLQKEREKERGDHS